MLAGHNFATDLRLLELGSFVGGSAIVTVKQILAHSWNVSVVTADTFLGDRAIIWEATAEQKQKLLRADGSISLYDRFKHNIQQNGYQSWILPLVATSVVTLRLVASLAEKRIIPLPQVIYLDSAHEEDEILLELRLAWKVLPVGGILFGDDWLMPDVETDVLRFAASIEGQLDDLWGREASFQSLGRSLSRARSGVFVAIESMQWFLQKKPSIERGAIESDTSTVRSPGFDCWGQGIFTRSGKLLQFCYIWTWWRCEMLGFAVYQRTLLFKKRGSECCSGRPYLSALPGLKMAVPANRRGSLPFFFTISG